MIFKSRALFQYVPAFLIDLDCADLSQDGYVQSI
jgi:hypothetical protein